MTVRTLIERLKITHMRITRYEDAVMFTLPELLSDAEKNIEDLKTQTSPADAQDVLDVAWELLKSYAFFTTVVHFAMRQHLMSLVESMEEILPKPISA